MEISALQVLIRNRGEAEPALFLAGSPAKEIENRVEELLGSSIAPVDRWAAAAGCAKVEEDIFSGGEEYTGDRGGLARG